MNPPSRPSRQIHLPKVTAQPPSAKSKHTSSTAQNVQVQRSRAQTRTSCVSQLSSKALSSSTVPQSMFPTNTDSVLFFTKRAPRALDNIPGSATTKVQKVSGLKFFENSVAHPSVQQQETTNCFHTGNSCRSKLSV